MQARTALVLLLILMSQARRPQRLVQLQSPLNALAWLPYVNITIILVSKKKKKRKRMLHRTPHHLLYPQRRQHLYSLLKKMVATAKNLSQFRSLVDPLQTMTP